MNKKMLIMLLAGLSLIGGSLIFAEEVKAKHQTICPVMGGKINKKLFVDVKGKRIYVCCGGCIGKIKNNPDKYIKTLKKAGITLENIKAENGKGAKTKRSGCH